MSDLEIWRTLRPYDIYQISSKGRIKNTKGRLLRPTVTTQGYHKVVLKDGISSKTCLVHRLVAKTFLENPDDLPVVHHKDTNKLNNNASNLQWVTGRDNSEFYHLGKISCPKSALLKIIEITKPRDLNDLINKIKTLSG